MTISNDKRPSDRLLIGPFAWQHAAGWYALFLPALRWLRACCTRAGCAALLLLCVFDRFSFVCSRAVTDLRWKTVVQERVRVRAAGAVWRVLRCPPKGNVRNAGVLAHHTFVARTTSANSRLDAALVEPKQRRCVLAGHALRFVASHASSNQQH
jgi:hypothetical protein